MTQTEAPWCAAFDAIEKTNNLKPLVAMLRSAEGEMKDVLAVIAELIDPQIGIFNVKLELKNKRGKPPDPGTATRHLQVALAMAEMLKKMPKKTSAAFKVAEDLGVDEKTVFNCWTPLALKYPDIFGKARPPRRSRTKIGRI